MGLDCATDQTIHPDTFDIFFICRTYRSTSGADMRRNLVALTLWPLRFLRKLLFPTVVEHVQSAYDITEPEARILLSGARNLGTFFQDNLGFSEDTWPIIVVGQFKTQVDDRGRYNDLRCFRRRLILDCEQKWGRSELSWSWPKWLRKRLSGVARFYKGIQSIEASADIFRPNRDASLNIKVLPKGWADLSVSVECPPDNQRKRPNDLEPSQDRLCFDNNTVQGVY